MLFVFALGILKSAQYKKLSEIFPQFSDRCKNLYGEDKKNIAITIKLILTQYIEELLQSKNNLKTLQTILQCDVSIDPNMLTDATFDEKATFEIEELEITSEVYNQYLITYFPFLSSPLFKPLLDKFVYFFFTLENMATSEQPYRDLGSKSFAQKIIDRMPSNSGNQETNSDKNNKEKDENKTKNFSSAPSTKTLMGVFAVAGLCILAYTIIIDLHQKKHISKLKNTTCFYS